MSILRCVKSVLTHARGAPRCVWAKERLSLQVLIDSFNCFQQNSQVSMAATSVTYTSAAFGLRPRSRPPSRVRPGLPIRPSVGHPSGSTRLQPLKAKKGDDQDFVTRLIGKIFPKAMDDMAPAGLQRMTVEEVDLTVPTGSNVPSCCCWPLPQSLYHSFCHIQSISSILYISYDSVTQVVVMCKLSERVPDASHSTP